MTLATIACILTFSAPVLDRPALAALYRASVLAETGVCGSQREERAFVELVMRESSGKVHATNPKSTAYGLGQFLAATRRAYPVYGRTARSQGRGIVQYVASRYGGRFSRAKAQSDRLGWY